MSSHEPLDNERLYLDLVRPRRPLLDLVQLEPRFSKSALCARSIAVAIAIGIGQGRGLSTRKSVDRRTARAHVVGLDKNHFVLAPMEIITNDELVAVSRQCGAGLGYEQCRFRLQLYEFTKSAHTPQPCEVEERKQDARLTLKETIYPSGVHSCTSGFNTLGTWSISSESVPWPD